MRTRLLEQVVGLGGVVAMTLVLGLLGVTNPTTIALSYLVVVLLVASFGHIEVAVVTSLAATLCFNFFFLPPVGTFRIAEPQNWVALIAFLVVSVVASRLSASARARAQEAFDRRNELTRLFDLSRDILLTGERRDASVAIARHVARRFELAIAAICVAGADGGWQVGHGGECAPEISDDELNRSFAGGAATIDVDARKGSSGGHGDLVSALGPMTLTPVRIGAKAIGLLACGGRPLEPGTRDAVAGIVAIALERSAFMEERRNAELSRQRAELSSALLASLSHDLRTPLTAIRTAVSNLGSEVLDENLRRDQAQVAAGQLARLQRLFDEILDMARIDSGSVQAQRAWTTPADVVDAALSHAAPDIAGLDIRIDARDDTAVEIDPRLAATGLAHFLENAAHYAPTAPIYVRGWTDPDGLRLEVQDGGAGLQSDDIERLFEPFYRGERSRQAVPGIGMGLAITRGLISADGGRVWAENVAPHGACFSIAVPGPTRVVAANECP